MAKAGTTELTGFTFRTGTIEYDYKPLAADMPGIQFRIAGPDGRQDGEEVYLRMFGECRASNDCILVRPRNSRLHALEQPIRSTKTRPSCSTAGTTSASSSPAKPPQRLRQLPAHASPLHRPPRKQLHRRLHPPPRPRRHSPTSPSLQTSSTASQPRPSPDPSAIDPGIVRHWQLSPLTPLPKQPPQRIPRPTIRPHRMEASRGRP